MFELLSKEIYSFALFKEIYLFALFFSFDRIHCTETLLPYVFKASATSIIFGCPTKKWFLVVKSPFMSLWFRVMVIMFLLMSYSSCRRVANKMNHLLTCKCLNE